MGLIGRFGLRRREKCDDVMIFWARPGRKLQFCDGAVKRNWAAAVPRTSTSVNAGAANSCYIKFRDVPALQHRLRIKTCGTLLFIALS